MRETYEDRLRLAAQVEREQSAPEIDRLAQIKGWWEGVTPVDCGDIAHDMLWLIAEVERLRDGATKPRLWERLYRAELREVDVCKAELERRHNLIAELFETNGRLEAHLKGCPYNGMEWWLGDES